MDVTARGPRGQEKVHHVRGRLSGERWALPRRPRRPWESRGGRRAEFFYCVRIRLPAGTEGGITPAFLPVCSDVGQEVEGT